MIKISLETDTEKSQKEINETLEHISVPIEIFVGLLRCVGYHENSIKEYINIEEL